jgi:hypothetical protein
MGVVRTAGKIPFYKWTEKDSNRGPSGSQAGVYILRYVETLKIKIRLHGRRDGYEKDLADRLWSMTARPPRVSPRTVPSRRLLRWRSVVL